jgi:DNA helicase-2/ATP-dependent DNA helicase PcrA
MTRAKNELYFSTAQDYGGARKKKLSRFMIEMGYKDQADDSKAKNQNGLLEEKPKIQILKSKTKPDYLPEHFSYSQLAAFEKCPLQYKFAFILKVPTRGKAVFSFGKTMHATLYDFLKMESKGADAKQDDLFGFKGEPSFAKAARGLVNFGTLTKIYEKNWIDEWYENKKQKEEYYELGKKIIKEFHREFENNKPKILKIGGEPALEMPFNLKIGEHTLFGVIDRIDQIGDSQVAIFDYKTGEAKEKLYPDDKEQLLIYQIAVEEIFKLKPKELIYYYLNENKKASFLGTEKEKNELKEKIKAEIEEIKSSNFKAAPGWQCSYCDFKDICDNAQR